PLGLRPSAGPDACGCCGSRGHACAVSASPPTIPVRNGVHHRMTITSPAPTNVPQVAVNDIGSEEEFLAAVDATIKYFNDGDIVEGTVVKVDRDEVLLDMVTRPKASSFPASSPSSTTSTHMR